MKKIFFLIMLLTIIIFPSKVEAYEISEDGSTYIYNICKEGCEYTNLSDIDNIYRGQLTVFRFGEGEYMEDYLYLYKYNDDNTVIIEGQGKDKTKIITNKISLMYINHLEIKNVSFENNNYISEDEWRDAFMELVGIDKLQLENVNVFSNYRENIKIEIPSNNTTEVLNNVNAIGATEYGIAIYKSQNIIGDSIKITNSDFSNNRCSVLTEISYSVARPENFKQNQMKIKLLTSTNDKKDLILENTKISCATAFKNNDLDAPVIYIPANNTWTIPPKKNENVFEVDGGRVIIEQEKEEAFELKSNVSKRISDIFKDVDLEDAVWENSNPEVAKIEKGLIIPLKKGETTLKTEVEEINYQLKVKVTGTPTKKEEIKNPQTSNLVNFLILTIFGITLFGIYITTYKRRNN